MEEFFSIVFVSRGYASISWAFLFELYLVCVFSCPVLFVIISQVIGYEDCL